VFGRKRGPYEQALLDKVEAIRKSLPEDATTLDTLTAAAALVQPKSDEEDSLADLGDEEPEDRKGEKGEGKAKEKPAPREDAGGIDGSSRLLEDLHLGDVEMMELELVVEELFGVRLTREEFNVPETLAELAEAIDKKK
jgi:acyl carrier protein